MATRKPAKSRASSDPKNDQLDGLRVQHDGSYLSTNQGQLLSDDHNSLKAGPRGPSLLEDFVLREKITHFDHERIPERIVHARGSGAYGFFECTRSLKKVSRAKFLGEVGKRTPVLVRFSTVQGARGSNDTVRDARGFAVKFYTEQGNYDLVGNNIPVFFIQDAMKFPDLVHAVKPEPHNDMPQGGSAHDTFWDFVSLMPESLHMVFWALSDRGIPRSLRMMEGFGVHTFRLVNARGEGTFVKFHWKPVLGVHGMVWDEASSLAGKDSDFHKRDLWEAIERGDFPEWQLGVQLIPEADEHKFPFDLLDPTKLVPEELVPVELVGRLVLNRNPDNFFAEIESAAFHPGHVVDGIDFTNDPLLQGRLFSYTDTQLIRLGGPNFHQLPPNRPIAPVHNHQRDGFGQQEVHVGRVAYEPNSLARGCPMHATADMGAFVHFIERVDAHKVRARSSSFADHISQPQLFYRSQTPAEQQHIADAFIFELSKVETVAIRERQLGLIAHVDQALANKVADKLGMAKPKPGKLPPNAADPDNNIVPPNQATAVARADDPGLKGRRVKLPETSPALSMVASNPGGVAGRAIAILIAPGVDAGHVKAVREGFEKAGAHVELVAPSLGEVKPAKGAALKPDKTLDSCPSLVFDVVVVPGGDVAALRTTAPALAFVAQAFKHAKTIGLVGDGLGVFASSPAPNPEFSGKGKVRIDAGVVHGEDASPAFVKALIEEAGRHRHFTRTGMDQVPV